MMQMCEKWVWTELLAFDNTSADWGVGEYLAGADTAIDGVSLLLSHLDFILLYDGMDVERKLFADVCSRGGHEGNLLRKRQNWSNFELSGLIRELQRHKVKVFFSVFPSYYHDLHHQEWASGHLETLIYYDDLGRTDGVNLLARLADGGMLEDLFVAQLRRVMVDYGFDGFHGPDGLGPGGVIRHNDCSDGFIRLFAEELGEGCPEEIGIDCGDDVALLAARMKYIDDHFHREFMEYHIRRWTGFWAKIIAMLRGLNRLSMMNSAWTKSMTEAIYIYGIDYRAIAGLGLDYLVVEALAANLAIINGGERHFDFAMTLLEMKAALPETKVLFLHGVVDVCESYDLLTHAPARLEREFFTLSNAYWVRNGVLERAAAGFLLCLGDGLSRENWKFLNRVWDNGFHFECRKAGEFTWIYDDSQIDWRTYGESGNYPAFKIMAALAREGGLNIQTIARFEELKNLSGNLIVPGLETFSAEKIAALRDYKNGVVLAVGFDHDRIIGEIFGKCKLEENSPRLAVADVPIYFWLPCAYRDVPDCFWRKLGDMARECIDQPVRIPAGREELCYMLMELGDHRYRLALSSFCDVYTIPEWETSWTLAAVEKISSFPYIGFNLKENKIYSQNNNHPLKIAPQGMIVMDLTTQGD